MDIRRIPDWKCKTPDELAGKAVRAFKDCWKDVQTSIRRYARTNEWPTPQIHVSLKKASAMWDSNSMRKYKSFSYNADTPPELRAFYMQDRKYGISAPVHLFRWLSNVSHSTLMKHKDTGLVAAVLFNQAHPNYETYFHAKSPGWVHSDSATFRTYIEPSKSKIHARQFLDLDYNISAKLSATYLIPVARILDKEDHYQSMILHRITDLRLNNDEGFWPSLDNKGQWKYPDKLIELMHCLPLNYRIIYIPLLFDSAHTTFANIPNAHGTMFKYVQDIIGTEPISLAQKHRLAETLDIITTSTDKVLDKDFYAWHPLIGNKEKQEDINKLIDHIDPSLLSYTLLFNTYQEHSPETNIGSNFLSENLE